MDSMQITEEKALEGFGAGVCCAMAVFGEMAPALGLDELTAKKIAAGFGSGLGKGTVCGCVTGALMALGLKYGNSLPGEVEQMQLFNAKRQEFEQKFAARCGSLICPEMLGGLNPAVPEQLGTIVEQGLMQKVCAPAVCEACEILQEVFNED